MHVGALSFGMDIFALNGDRENCTPCIRARAAVLEEKLHYAEELMVEILTRTKFSDKEKNPESSLLKLMRTAREPLLLQGTDSAPE